ncbi:MAG: transposase [Deltaproteobacteria bacterium]|jgi:hypothetical protein|nr:transposase [Deltaproteobacteria bacterium]
METERTATCPACGAVSGAAPGGAAFPCPVCGHVFSPAPPDAAGSAADAAVARRNAEAAYLLLGAFLAVTGAVALLSPRTGVPAALAGFAWESLILLGCVLLLGLADFGRLRPFASVSLGLPVSAVAGLVLAAFEYRFPSLVTWTAVLASAEAFVLTVPYLRATGKNPFTGSTQLVTTALAAASAAALTLASGAGGAAPWIASVLGLTGNMVALGGVELKAKDGSSARAGAWRAYSSFFIGATVAAPFVVFDFVRLIVRSLRESARSSGGEGGAA